MNIELKNFITSGQTMGYVAYFDVRLECGVLVRNLALQLPEKYPGEAWLVLPALARDDRRTVHFPPELRNEIGHRAAAAYSAVSGVTLKYTPPRPKGTVPESSAGAGVPEVKKPGISEWLDRHESDDAGLKRAIRMGVPA
jgi:hypothetical protein